jgi:hypothetical protein
LGFLILVLTGLFPPVNRVRIMKVINESDGSEEAQEVQSEFHGYRFYFSMDHHEDGQEYRVAKIILAGEWLLLLLLVRTLFVAFRDNKPNLPQSRIFRRP